MQYEFKYILKNSDAYNLKRLDDTILNGQNCYQLLLELKDKITMPNFGVQLRDMEGQVSKTVYYIDKTSFYPIRIKGENYNIENPGQKIFMNQRYYDIQFNLNIDEQLRFNTSREALIGFSIREITPE
jgi:hypothetical protein